MAESGKSFYEVLTDAINDMTEFGFDDPSRVARWQELLRKAAEATLGPISAMDEMLRRSFQDIYRRMVEKHGLLKYHPGVQRWIVDKLKPQLRLELEKRILASADLIKLNRQQSVAKMLQRFLGLATSIPPGGVSDETKTKLKTEIRKPLASLPFEARRVAIDQGAKFLSALNDVIATDQGALAYVWHSHWRQAGYNYRPDHKERDGLVYALRDSWALKAGLINTGAGYYDEITAAAQEPFCRCFVTALYSLRAILKYDPDMLTNKGRAEFERTRVA